MVRVKAAKHGKATKVYDRDDGPRYDCDIGKAMLPDVCTQACSKLNLFCAYLCNMVELYVCLHNHDAFVYGGMRMCVLIQCAHV